MSRDDQDDWETMQALEPRAGEDLERTLERYARVRLDPTAVQTKRARAALMEAAWRSRLQPESHARHWRLPFASWTPRRLALAATAAVLAGLMIGSSAFAASRAGGPLYDARIAVEDALLPADPAARLQAQLANAQMRLAEAYDAESRSDATALVAALRAYDADATALAAITGPGAPVALAAIQQHRTLLVALVAQAPAAALPGLSTAIASSDNAIEALTRTDRQQGGSGGNGNGGGSGSGGSGSGGGSNGSGGGSNGSGGGSNGSGGHGSGGGINGSSGGGSGGGSNGSGGHGNPGATAAPVPTPSPDATPTPDVTPKPAPTPKPDHTPKEKPSTPAALPSTPAP